MSGNFNIASLSEDLFRKESGKIAAVLTRVLGIENLDLTEDVLQETFLSAIQVWTLKGIPDNPSGWLFKTAKNKAIDVLRKNKFSRLTDFNDPERTLLKSEYTIATVIEKIWQTEEIEDDLLRMMYACCHPGIPEENQITLILKTLCGFSTGEIAKAFFTTEEAISKRLYRTKNFFRDRKIRPSFPDADQMHTKTEAVLRAIYLIFNEGYNATHAETFIRKDLLEQALYLCRMLAQNANTRLPEVYAAMALMCFHSARIDSRIGEDGEIVLLAYQERGKWNQQLINEGNSFLNKAAFGEQISSYHIEAAIAYEHCIAESFEQTNWQNILQYYNMLVAIHPGAVVELHRLTVMYKVFGAERALDEIKNAPCKEDWEKNYLYHALLGDIYAERDKDSSKRHYETAIRMTLSEAEKSLLVKKINSLNVQ